MAAGLVAALPIIASGADFDYSHYEAVLKRHINTGVSINSIRLNAIDYNSIAREAKQPGSDYSILLKELAAFDPGTLKNREEKIAFWGRRGRPCDHASRDRSSCGTLSACLDKPEQTRLARCITSSAVG